MRFVVPLEEFDFYVSSKVSKDVKSVVDSATSVNQLKTHYFETLSKIGEIIKIENNIESNEIKELCQQDDVCFATFHESPPDNLACRLLNHSKGGLMLPGGFLNRWAIMDTTLNIVTTHQQADQLNKSLKKAAPLLSVFVPRMNTYNFRLPSNREKENARLQFKIKSDCFHIVYAGRFIANKGIAQLVRAMNLWPEQNIRITLVGNFEPDFFIYQSNANHATFAKFFKREIVEKNQNLELVCLPSMNHNELRNLFWSADCFVYPSFHEDENFGATPREAILCGVPVVVSDFCGLGQLAATKGAMVNTYATLAGVRYSLKQLSEEILKIKAWTEKEKKFNTHYNSEWVGDECDTKKSEQSLKMAAEQLLKIPLGEAPTGDWRSKERFDKWVKKAPNAFQESVALAKTHFPEGLYVDGTGEVGLGWYSEPHFLKAIQGIYTTYPIPPKVVKGNCYRGFWRIAIWPEEQAIVEFGFPGPRVKRYNKTDWEFLIQNTRLIDNNEQVFYPSDSKSIDLVKDLVELGYLVPDEL